MISLSNLLFFQQCLAKATIKAGRTHSIAYSMEMARRQFARHSYILNVLRAGPNTIERVKNLALALPDSPGHRQLATLLALFQTFSAQEKAEFIHTYKACANVVSDGLKDIAVQTAWQANHIPPLPPEP